MARPRFDPYLAALFACVALATILPARGVAAVALDRLTDSAITLLFFLYGARLSPRDAWEGARHVRLHALVLAFTYLLFPALGLASKLLVPAVLTPELYVGVVFLCTLPSTVQSSIAFTSLARGNVAAALCSATLSNLLGVVATPLLLSLLLRSQGVPLSSDAVPKLVLQLLVPFFVGQLLRPRAAPLLARHPRALGLLDRGSILLVIYAAFSAGVRAGIWQRLSPLTLGSLLLLNAALLALVLTITTASARALRFSQEDEIAIVFCGSKKSLASGLPMASVLFPDAGVGLIALPLMLFHQLQLMACAWLARRYARRR